MNNTSANRKIANRYAKALLEMCEKEGCQKDVAEDLSSLQTALSSQAINRFFNNPTQSTENKKNVLNTLFKNAHPMLMRFALFMTSKKRLSTLPLLPESFRLLWEKKQKHISINIASAAPLSDEQKNNLHSQIEKKLPGYTLLPVYTLSPELLGGIRIKYEDTIIEYNLKQSLASLRSKLVEL